ncbi:MAG: hypothetical protein A2381_00185 [Bdellovibrionales bacterium RIFOXYB1_FULL_37_110]|nr:MAG: hypothetical protein A2417_11240 [Bdellovibrionales bacterium RIFOXYC1_FULL_37_79]OFZ60812.1 MAG: hypothetical protein A2381_00185 [Bdellovibrionales bacterium RIFOXYB1_FULL_37_110]OFZ62342.1 MAG: hypothetical protein A2577_02850 [Bdellovibrionales bacterium RIFOXYD1_FULL_36_51]
MIEIENEYQRLKSTTHLQWDKSSEEGADVGPPYDQNLFGITCGAKFNPVGELHLFLENLRLRTSNNPSLDITTNDHLHFTFLALSPLTYKNKKELPREVDELKRISKKVINREMFSLTQLRLVPLKNTILLAGIPTDDSFKLRNTYVRELLNSSWAAYLQERYIGHEIPPKIWHTTLVRTRNELLPVEVRELYLENLDKYFGNLNFEKIELIAANYNWSKIIQL